MQKLDLSEGLDPLSDRRRFVAPSDYFFRKFLSDPYLTGNTQSKTQKTQSKCVI